MDEGVERQEASSTGFAQVLYLEKEAAALEQGIVESKENLENLQKEIAQAEQKKAETEDQIKNVLANAEKKKAALLMEITTHTKQKRDLETQCAELAAKIEQMDGTLDERFRELQDKNAKVEEADNQLKRIKSDRKRISRKGKLAVIVVLGVAAAVIIFGRFYYEERISDLRYSCRRAEVGRSDALAKLSELKEYAGPAMVKVNSVYNGDIHNEKIGDLESSEMRFLCLDLNVHFLEDDVNQATIYMDIYRPDGSLMTSDDSPMGHSTFFTVGESDDKKIGWGNEETSIYPAGTYRVEFVYNDEMIHAQKVEITWMDSFWDGIKLTP